MTSTAVTSQSLAAEHDRLRKRRDTLQENLNDFATRAAALTTQRTAHLIAGRDADAAALSEQIRAVRDDQAALSDAVAALDRELAAVEERQRVAGIAEERQAAAIALEQATATFAAKRDAMVGKARQVAREFARDLDELRALSDAGAAACERLNRATGETGPHWDASLFTFDTMHEGEMIKAAAARAASDAFKR
jgi:uncharacterized protein YhaN